MSITPQKIYEIIDKYLHTDNNLKKFKKDSHNLLISNNGTWAPFVNCKTKQKRNINYYPIDTLQKDIYLFLIKNYNNLSITTSLVKRVIKMIEEKIVNNE